mmetsp:Transcript_20730/g.37380  ORF Transcript_20730/g.37380 Transcript_20730/m.37380 type:complete len:229 (-) Transcript_20730:74-760(-)
MHSLILSETFKKASVKCKLGVQSISMSIMSPSWMVDPFGNRLHPDVRIATGFKNGYETAMASTDPSAFFCNETSIVTMIGACSVSAAGAASSVAETSAFSASAAFSAVFSSVVSSPLSSPSAAVFSSDVASCFLGDAADPPALAGLLLGGRSIKQVTVQLPRSISSACSLTLQNGGKTAVTSSLASSGALSVVRARSSRCSRVDHISAFFCSPLPSVGLDMMTLVVGG